MAKNYTTAEVIDAIETCAELEHIWYNGKVPSKSFKRNVTDIKRLLTKLLETKCKCGGDK